MVDQNNDQNEGTGGATNPAHVEPPPPKIIFTERLAKDAKSRAEDAQKKPSDVSPQSNTNFRFEDPARQLQDIKNEFQKDKCDEKIKSSRQTRQHESDIHSARLNSLRNLFLFAVGWAVLLVIIVILQGFRCLGFNLSDTVLIAFMTTTTTTVLGLYGIGAYWLYKSNKIDKKQRSKEDQS